jgi:predicted MPP superfamily phosphohydrolase
VQRHARSRRSPLRWVVLGVCGLAFSLGLWAFWFEPNRLVFHRVTLELPHWPAPLRGFRVALMSDLHVGSLYWDVAHVRQLVEETNRQQPDLILLAGDYTINGVKFGTWTAPEDIAEALGGLRAPYGTIAVLGNHDWWNRRRRIRRAFTDAGITVLEDEVQAITTEKGRFFVVGLADAMMGHPDIPGTIAKVPAGEPFLVLVHEPDVFPEIDARASLTMAGHTHGGQVWLPLLGRLVVPSEYGQRYAVGHVVEEGRHLYVTSGVGTSIAPVRFGVPPEVVLLELR